MIIQQPKVEALKEAQSKRMSYNINNEMSNKIKILYQKWKELLKEVMDRHQTLTQTKLKHVSQLMFNYFA